MQRMTAPWVGAALALGALAAPASTDLSTPERSPLGQELASTPALADPASPSEPPLVEPTGVLRLADALAAALLGNPMLAARSYEIRAREALALQAGLRPRPSLALSLEDVAGSGDFRGVREAEATIRLGQLVELGGKRAARVRAAEAEQQLAGWDYESARVEVLAGTAAAFVAVLAAQERLRLADEALAVARAVRRAAAHRVAAGLASPAEEIRAGVGVDEASVEREHADHELETARTVLAAAWGGTQARFERADGDLADLPEVPPLPELERRAAASPELARWEAERERREAELARARSERIPDLTIAAGPRYRNGPGDTALVFDVSVPLPLWNRNQGAIAEAAHRRAQAEAERRAAEVRVLTELANARTALRAAVEEAQLLAQQVVPGIERAAEVLRRGYEAGRTSQLEVLEAERARLAAHAQQLRAQVEAHRAALEIERLTGTPLEAQP
ncbi:MAG TPA: TolC family protein [Myxococcota bacterium]|jgi:cobalt-zinc-cadmium efflux system outer membrane protein